MTINELETYFNQNWNKKDFCGTVTELSKPHKKGKPLSKSDFKMYNFDIITRNYFKSEEPTSVDGVYFLNGNLHLVEFKTGFYQEVRRDSPNFDPKKGCCPHITNEEYVCPEYWDEFTKRQDREIDILLDSLKLKAVESYLFLEKQIGFVKDKLEKGKILLHIVTDENGIDGMETAMEDLVSESNTKSRVKSSLHRFMNRTDINGNVYCYDNIDVYNGESFALAVSK